MLFSIDGLVPKVHESAFIAPTAVLISDVEVPPNTMMLGVPAKPAGETLERHHRQTEQTAAGYQRNRGRHLQGLAPLGDWAQWLKVGKEDK